MEGGTATVWALNSQTPYAAERIWLRDKEGAHRWVIAVKATFALAENGAVRLADEQVPPLLVPEYYGQPGTSSLRYDADLVPDKPTTDVVLNASAYAPRGKPATMVPVAIKVGPITKKLHVFGMRVFFRSGLGLALSAPASFVERPIRYEWAYGGTNSSDPDPRLHVMDKRNPIGKGHTARSQNLIDQPGPCIEYPDGSMAKRGPAGFGAIASYWSPRLELAGTYDARWQQTRNPLLPVDYDKRHVLCAPVDQRPATHLRGGEEVVLLNLTRTGLLHFLLPTLRLRFVTSFGRRLIEHFGWLATVIIESDTDRLFMVWQTSLGVPPTDSDSLDETRVEEMVGAA